MKTIILILVIIAALFLAGCTSTNCGTLAGAQQATCCAELNKGKPVVECQGRWLYDAGCKFKCYEYCTKESTGDSLEVSEAKAIAENSNCTKQGHLKGTYQCNPVTGTWWFDLDAQDDMCKPACVVKVDTKEAKINWRCTGLMPPGSEETGTGFCGSSDESPCKIDDDCVAGGCSGQVCTGKNVEPIVTTCIYKNCYNSDAYGLNCKCISGLCRWN